VKIFGVGSSKFPELSLQETFIRTPHTIKIIPWVRIFFSREKSEFFKNNKEQGTITMKITIDTEVISNNTKMASSFCTKYIDRMLSGFTDREVLFICFTIVLSGYIISHYYDNISRNETLSRIGIVEGKLDMLQEDVNRLKNAGQIEVEIGSKSNSLDVSPNSHIQNDGKIPKTKYPQIYNTRKRVNLSESDFDCLSRNIYWETMHEPLIGQLSVAQISYNRVLEGKWGNSFCEVIFAPKQFSWTNFKKIRNAVPKNKKQWIRAKHSAFLFSKGVRVPNLIDSQFYFADYIKPPKWSKSMTKVAKIGKHIFYAQN
jgi:N-acetylmuramoyl-L-alanine amidase